MVKEQHDGVSIQLQTLIDCQSAARKLILPHRLASNTQSGGYLSAMRGRGMDFEEVRAYCPGDDVRAMDWRVTARTTHPHVKVYREERERPVIVVVDFAASMFFGTKVAFKSVVAAQVAALLTWATVFGGDRIGAVLLTDKKDHVFMPERRTAAALRILKALSLVTQHQGQTHLVECLARLQRTAPKGSVIVLLSDFETFNQSLERELSQLSRRHQLVAGLIYDPLESDIPDIGVCQFTNGQEYLQLNTQSRTLRLQYHQQFLQKVQTIEKAVGQMGQSVFQLATNQHILPVLHDVLQRIGGIHA